MTDLHRHIDVPGPACAVEVRLVIDAGDPLKGTVRTGEDPRARPFHGWIELMAVINAARTADHDH